MPEKVETRQSGVKGNFYAPFVGEGKRATASSYPTIRIPLEISGVVGSSVLFLTGFLVWSGRWDIIRSPYFSIGLAVLMAVAVIIKFVMANSKKKSPTNKE